MVVHSRKKAQGSQPVSCLSRTKSSVCLIFRRPLISCTMGREQSAEVSGEPGHRMEPGWSLWDVMLRRIYGVGQSVVQSGKSLRGMIVADGDGHRLLLPDKNDQFSASSDCGIEQVPL